MDCQPYEAARSPQFRARQRWYAGSADRGVPQGVLRKAGEETSDVPPGRLPGRTCTANRTIAKDVALRGAGHDRRTLAATSRIVKDSCTDRWRVALSPLASDGSFGCRARACGWSSWDGARCWEGRVSMVAALTLRAMVLERPEHAPCRSQLPIPQSSSCASAGNRLARLMSTTTTRLTA